MKLGRWRALLVLAAALSVGLSVYEFFAPRIDLVDGPVALVGEALSIPGQPATKYRVVAETPGSNLAAAGIEPGDVFVPRDSFFARWLWLPGQQIPVTVIRNGVTRTTTIIASSRHIPMTVLDWVERVVRIVLRIALLLLALILAWQIPDARWVRWLCASLVLFGFSPWAVYPYDYLGWQRIATNVVEASATQAAICAALIFSALIGSSPPGDFRRWMVRLAPWAFIVLELCVAGFLFDNRGDYVARPLRLIEILCIAATVASLAAAAAQATGQERQRLRYMAWTFAIGFSGFFVSDIAIWAAGNWALNVQQWSLPRITLLLIPIGLGYGLLSHRVASIHYIASRTLVYGAITSSFVPIYAATEWAATDYFGNRGKNALVVAIAVVITALFKKIRSGVEDVVSRLLFKRQRETENALAKFAKQVPHISDAACLQQRFVDLVDEYVASVSTALYFQVQASSGSDGSARAGYVRSAEAGEPAPEKIGPLDPVVAPLASEGTAIESDLLGAGGHAFPMILHGELVGLLAVGPLRDGEILSPDEIKRLTDITQAVAVALEGMRRSDLEQRLAQAETGRAELHRVLSELARGGAIDPSTLQREPPSVHREQDGLQ